MIFECEVPLTFEDCQYEEHVGMLDLSAFLRINDFEVLAYDADILGTHLYFFSQTHGALSSFPWWDHVERDLAVITREKIPLGTCDNPYDELEQGWQIVIWEHDGVVYVMEGNDACCLVFPRWYSVDKKVYLAAWEKCIRAFKPDFAIG